MYTELLARAQVASIQQEVEAQRWAREWRALGRSPRGVRNHACQRPADIARPKAGLPEGR
ncbi:MAG: hypothetical protein C0506_07930 [Anaerolinea sp.]|nr:hypothetical protein [Anaerolinea sp.]